MEELTTEATTSGVDLCVESLVKSYQLRGGTVTQALSGVSFEVPAGQFVTLVGPSGCGKSTVLDMIAGLQGPDSGWVSVGGKEIRGPGPDRAVVFQQYALFPWLSVIDNVVFPLRARSIPKHEGIDRAREMVRLVGLAGFEEHYPYQLSGGMKQRVALARALVVGPQLLLMDEPFAALDAQTRELLQDELLKIWRMSRRSIIFVTHSLEEALHLSTRVILMTARPGRVKAQFDVPRASNPEEDADRVWEERRLEMRHTIWSLLREELPPLS